MEVNVDLVMIRRDHLNDAIREAARLGAEMAIRMAPKDRASQYTLSDAAKELGISRPTLSKVMQANGIALNACGKVSREDVERLIYARAAA